MQHVKRLSNAKILQNKTIRFLLPGSHSKHLDILGSVQVTRILVHFISH